MESGYSRTGVNRLVSIDLMSTQNFWQAGNSTVLVEGIVHGDREGRLEVEVENDNYELHPSFRGIVRQLCACTDMIDVSKSTLSDGARLRVVRAIYDCAPKLEAFGTFFYRDLFLAMGQTVHKNSSEEARREFLQKLLWQIDIFISHNRVNNIYGLRMHFWEPLRGEVCASLLSNKGYPNLFEHPWPVGADLLTSDDFLYESHFDE